ncbi:hypothetical protein LNV23_08685 [Paucibacter sp. DJ1R-11]|uniref:hypothetical protein n=1 Tax=Paucibacter sp. DJ1R-11 TaxID=2893556 RepID=UPI0021E3EFB0|nr:hypothetical protein [Paucibacter sp. DJ1R-11]MCV2363522.1 hypothetical protein [Paucibacter sp. DJ1R-11]
MSLTRTVLLLTLLSSALNSPVLADDTPPVDTFAGCAANAPKAALQAFAEKVDAFWNARDAGALAALYASDASFAVAADNVQLSDREQVQAYFNHSFQTLPADLKHKMSVSRVKRMGEFCSMDSRAVIGRIKADGSMNAMVEFSAFWVLRPTAQGVEVQAVRVAMVPAKPAAAAKP